MYHHDSSRSYPVAASEAAAKARVKMEETIQRGLASAQQVIEQIQSQVPRDRLVTTQLLKAVAVGGDGYHMVLPGEPDTKRLHEHALGQLCSRTGMPGRYLKDLSGQGEWGANLAAHNLNTLLAHERGRNLVRTVEGERGPEVRGFLSDRFRRIDSRPLVESFVAACRQMGLVPIEGFGLETKVRLRAALPEVFEPAPSEVMMFGLEWGNSDFGDGGHTLRLWNQRIWCSNTAVMDEALRQVHLGGRIPEDVSLSQRTLELDSQANASVLQDVVREFIGPERVAGYLERIKDAVAIKVDEKDVTRLLKKDLNDNELRRVQDVFGHPDGINVPPGGTRYSLANAVSWIAQAQGTGRQRRLELEEVSGRVMGNLLHKNEARSL